MYTQFLDKLKAAFSLSQEQEDQLVQYLIAKKIRKRQYILQESDVARTLIFVSKGAIRSYVVTQKGTEVIMNFATEGRWIADLNSFLTGNPATFNIDALEDSELILLTQENREKIAAIVPEFDTYIFKQITDAYLQMQKRLVAVLSLSPEERYKNFVNQFPGLLQRFPQHMIASHMGLTPETLSRIRRKLKD